MYVSPLLFLMLFFLATSSSWSIFVIRKSFLFISISSLSGSFSISVSWQGQAIFLAFPPPLHSLPNKGILLAIWHTLAASLTGLYIYGSDPGLALSSAGCSYGSLLPGDHIYCKIHNNANVFVWTVTYISMVWTLLNIYWNKTCLRSTTMSY